jgi:deoxyadenosine/deoxycytidine kinase
MDRARYIAVEGPIGVGKTTLAELLAGEVNGKALVELVETNPFLPNFYRDRKKYALYQQQKDLAQIDLFSTTVISDYLFAKDRIFAYLNLDENELGLYEQVFRLLDARIPKPELVIYLQASSEVLKERILKRNKEYERDIEEGYLESVVEAYNKFFFYYNDTPLLVVNTTKIDFAKESSDLSNLIKEIRSIKGGIQHYIPLGSR